MKYGIRWPVYVKREPELAVIPIKPEVTSEKFIGTVRCPAPECGRPLVFEVAAGLYDGLLQEA